MYHAFTLPLEDFYRVYNYHTPADEKMDMVSVGASLKNAHGQAAVNYIDQLLTDLNGGARSDPREFFGKSLVSNFKKASVMASLSVVVQQPTAIVRAMALVDAKYFAGKKVEKGKHKEMWAEVKKYAPVAVIKEMGYFDIGMGQGSVEWLNSNEYHGIKEKAKAFVKDGSYRDEVLSKLPALADEVAWVSIWNAVKRETVHTHKNLRPNSEEFLKVVGERFTEVVTKTQVYDSTLARSANMRSKSGMMKMWTAFMAEPTTSINMLQDAFRKGNKKYIVRALGAVYGSVILNSALVSLIYAMRDDDEDETFLEKYLSRLTTEIVDGINPLTYIPFVKDIWSIAQGFDVERADMSLITDAFDSLQQMVRVIAKDTSDMDEKEIAEHRKAFSEAILSITDSLSSFFGVPVKNVRRDINGVINAFNTIKKDITERDTTAGSLGDNILEDVKNTVPVWGWFPDESKGDKLYDAIIKGDTAYVDRIKNGYKDDKAYESAVRKALRENDPRIKEAAVARYSGRNDEYMRIASEIKAEGKFSQDTIVAAINAEISKLKPDKESEVSSPKYVTVDDYYNSVVNGDTGTARTIVDMLVKEKLEEGYLQVEAENSIATSFTTKVKEAYMDGEVTRSKAVSLLVSHGNKSNSEAEAEVKKCDFELKHDIPWSERARAYRLGKISKSTLISAVMDIEGETWEDAEAYVRFLDLEKNNPTIDITASDAASYFEHAEPAGIGIEMYLNYKDQTKGLVSDKDAKGNSISSSKKKKVMAVINSLPISSYQKDALYLAEGWAKDKLYEAPWH
jgi:putative NIF3 family GTP cyclohydrolase 1 type 2